MASTIDTISSLTNKSNTTVNKADSTNGDFSKILQESMEEINDSQVKGGNRHASLI